MVSEPGFDFLFRDAMSTGFEFSNQIPDADEFSCGVVPVHWRDGEPWFLLVRHRSGHWSFPKGRIEAGETPLQTALRELGEETGIRECELYPGVFFEERYRMMKFGKPKTKAVRYFLGKVANPEVRMQVEEIMDHAWLPADEARVRLTFAEAKRILAEALLRLGA